MPGRDRRLTNERKPRNTEMMNRSQNENESDSDDVIEVVFENTPTSRAKRSRVCSQESSASSSSPTAGRPLREIINLPILDVSSLSLNQSDSFEEDYEKTTETYDNASELPFKAMPGYSQYRVSTYVDREKMLAKNARIVEEHPDHYAMAHKRFLARIQKDPQLRSWEYKPTEKEILDRMFCVLSRRTLTTYNFRNSNANSRPPPSQIKKKKKRPRGPLPAPIENYIHTQSYIPTGNRIRITKNLTFNKKDSLPVFTDIKGERLDRLLIPRSLLYDYDDRNRIDPDVQPELIEIIELSKKEENIIKCTCCSADPVVPCFKNENCPCYRMNRKLQDLQNSKNPTEFGSFGGIYINKLNPFYFFAGFACSEECSCKGNCSNNSLLISQKKVFPLELFRRDWDVGFGVRSHVMIPAGIPIMEFVGEIVEEKYLNEHNRDYAYQIVYDDDEKNYIGLLEKLDCFPSDYHRKLIEVSQRPYLLDPKLHGNIGRTVCHSCTANTEVVRIYQKSLSPAHLHLMIVTLQDIYPGTPITMDYGRKYVEDMLITSCKCGTFACHNGANADDFNKLSVSQLTQCFKKLNAAQYEKWEKQKQFQSQSMNNQN